MQAVKSYFEMWNETDATKRARHTDPAEAKAILQDLVINVSERGGNVDVRTEYQRYSPRQRYRNGYTASVDYTVTVPRDAAAARSPTPAPLS